MPPHVRKRTLEKVDGNKGLGYVDDTYASKDGDMVSSNGADEYGDGPHLQDTASLDGKHTTITPPTTKVLLSVTTPNTMVKLLPTE